MLAPTSRYRGGEFVTVVLPTTLVLLTNGSSECLDNLHSGRESANIGTSTLKRESAMTKGEIALDPGRDRFTNDRPSGHLGTPTNHPFAGGNQPMAKIIAFDGKHAGPWSAAEHPSPTQFA